LLHLGGTKIFGILLTMDARQGVQAIHYNDYTVFKSLLEGVMHAVEDAGLSDRGHYLSHGETYNFHV
jgi:hypothetical protein